MDKNKKILKGVDLAGVIETGEKRCLLKGDSTETGVLYFGKKGREVELPVDSKVVIFKNDGAVQIEKLDFGKEGRLDYTAELKRKGITFDIPKSLPQSPFRWQTRFEYALFGYGLSSLFCFAKNGWAVFKSSYIGDDCYRNFILTMNEKSFTIGDKVIDGIVAYDADYEFVERALTRKLHVDEGDELLGFLKTTELYDVRIVPKHQMDYIQFFSDGDIFYCDTKGILDKRNKTVAGIREELEFLLDNAWITDWDDINNQCCNEEFDGTNLEYTYADSEEAADLEEYKELVKSAIPEGDDADNTFMSWWDLKEGSSLRQEISKVIARELKTEDITYDELVLRLAFFLSGIKNTWELHRMVDYVKEYRKSVGMSWPGKENS